MDLTNCFFLQAIDPDYGCPVLEAMFYVADLSHVQSILGHCADDDPELRRTYDLDKCEISALCEQFGVAFEPDEKRVELCRWHSLRGAPYLVHTNYELILLLEGVKKFARMDAEYPPHSHHNEELFESYVAAGVLYRETELKPFPRPFTGNDGHNYEGIRTVYYALKGEEWRIAAWRMLVSASAKTSWDETFERLEGMLFGYAEWQVDWWMRHWRPPPPVHSTEVLQKS